MTPSPKKTGLSASATLTGKQTLVSMVEYGFKLHPLPRGMKFPPPENYQRLPGLSLVESLSKSESDIVSHNWLIHPSSGNIFVDYDVKHPEGREAFEAHRALFEEFGLTPIFQTGTGGWHVLFSTRHLGRELAQKVGFIPGVDTRTHRGYVIAPGSYVAEQYRLDPATKQPLGDGHYSIAQGGDVQPIPQQLADLIGFEDDRRADERERKTPLAELDQPDSLQRAREYLENDAPHAIEGAGGDHTTYAVAARLKDIGVSEDTALDLMLDHWNEAKAQPPWEPYDLQRKIANAYAYGQNRPALEIARSAEHAFRDIPAMADPGPPPAANPVNLHWRKNAKRRHVKWLIDGLIPHGAFITLFGQPGSYKSFEALYLAASVVSGQPAHGRAIEARGDVVYVAGEGGFGMLNRIEAIESAHNLYLDRLAILDHPIDLRSSRADADALLAAMRAIGARPVLIVIDTLSRAFAGGNENASEDMTAFIAVIDHIRAATGAAVLVVHHSGKDTAKGMRGHSALFGAVDTEIEVTKTRATADGSIGAGEMKVTKQKDGPDGWSCDWAVELIRLGGDEASLAVREFREGETRGVKATLETMDAATYRFLEAVAAAANESGFASHKDITDWARALGALDRANGNAVARKQKQRFIRSLVECGAVQPAEGGVVVEPQWLSSASLPKIENEQKHNSGGQE